ncbi:MAG: ABC transporter permease [Oscillospiraceae bacterium]
MKTMHIARRIIQQTVSDRRSLALILIVPLFLFTLIYFLLGDSGYKPHIGISGLPAQLSERIADQDVTVDTLSVDEGIAEVKNKTLDALLYVENGQMTLLFETNDAGKTREVEKAVQSALAELLPSNTSLNIDFLYGSRDENMFNALGYVMLGIISFFFVFIIAGISFVRERTTQTMERLMVTPVKRWQVILGYTLGFGFFAVIQSVLLLSYVRWVLGLAIAGPVTAAGLVMILLALSAVCIGAFFSIFSENEFQLMQFIPVAIIPQIFFSGLISLDTLPYHLGTVAKIMPVYYACDALKTITIRGGTLENVIPDLLALLVFIALFFMLNILSLKKFRRI